MKASLMPPISSVHDVGALTEAQRSELFALYERYYEAAEYDRFCCDLADKDSIVVLRDPAGELQGFTTLTTQEHEFRGERLRVIFSGDTIVDERSWGQQALAFGWIRLAGCIRAERPATPLYWFLISKGHRTYRYLSAFSHRFYPTPDRETPSYEQSLLDFLAVDRFGPAYDKASGTIRFSQSHGHLKAAFAAPSALHQELPEVRFFLARNPGYVRGDELACLCKLEPDNLQPIARRAFVSAMRRPSVDFSDATTLLATV
jgi:hypothetical protein